MKNNEYKLIISSSSKSSDIYYASGLMIPDDFIYLENIKTSQKIVVVSPLEFNRAKNSAKSNIDVLCTAQFKNSNQQSSLGAILQNIIKKYEINKVIIPFDFPSGYYQLFLKNNIEVIFVDGEFFPARICKNDYELKQIALAQKLNEATISYGCSLLSDASVNNKQQLIYNNEIFTSEKFKNILNSFMVERGAYCDTLIASCGIDSSEPHNSGSGVLFANKPIVIDNFPRLTDSCYWGDMTRTVVKGIAPEIVKRAFNAVYEAKNSVLQLVKADVAVKDLHNKAIEVLEKYNFKTFVDDNGCHVGFIHGLGHGVGLDIHEAPRVSKNVEHRLLENSVITIEPGVYYPEWGGVRLEDLLVVKKDGCELLNDPQCILEI